MIEGRRRANALAHQFVDAGSLVSDGQLLEVLRLWGLARSASRRNVAPPGMTHIFSECFGLVYDRTGKWVVSTVTQMFPHVACLLNAWLRTRLAQLAHESG